MKALMQIFMLTVGTELTILRESREYIVFFFIKTFLDLLKMHKCDFKVLCKPAVMSKFFCPWAHLIFCHWARAAHWGSEVGHLCPYVDTKVRAEEEPPPLRLSSDPFSELPPHKPNTFRASTNLKSAPCLLRWQLRPSLPKLYIAVSEGMNFTSCWLCWYNPCMAFLGFAEEPQATATLAVSTWELCHSDGAKISMRVRVKSEF